MGVAIMNKNWETKDEPLKFLINSIKFKKSDEEILNELKDMFIYKYINEFGVNTCDSISLLDLYWSEVENGLRGFAETICNIYPDIFIPWGQDLYTKLKKEQERFQEERQKKVKDGTWL